MIAQIKVHAFKEQWPQEYSNITVRGSQKEVRLMIKNFKDANLFSCYTFKF